MPDTRELTPAQQRIYDIIFGTKSPAGKGFDVSLIVIIVFSVVIVMLDSIPEYNTRFGTLFVQLEWVFTLFFTVEYLVRIWCSPNRRAYILSPYGIIDLLALLPTYMALILPQTAPLLIIRLLRILRIFRVLRLASFSNEANTLMRALNRSWRKIFVFFSVMMVITTIFGCLLYVIEGNTQGFDNIPKSIYWAIVTVTTVGYGDVVPLTPLGRAVSAVVMLTGYAIIAVPTGIITAEISKELRSGDIKRHCTHCNRTGHKPEAKFCWNCGTKLQEE